MKKLFYILLIHVFAISPAMGQTIIEIKPNQSMHLIGKGPGQESVINPYAGSKSAAIITNMGKKAFEIRIQVKGEIIDTITIEPGKSKEIELFKGQELYIDGDVESRSKAMVDFRKL